MVNGNLIEKTKFIMILVFSFFLIILFDVAFHPNNYYTILKSPLVLVRLLPSIILLYYFLKEISLLVGIDSNHQEYTLEKDGIVFIQDYDIWISILETQSLDKINRAELKQLKYLELFSLELDTEKYCLRVYVFSKSIIELRKRIKKLKPILDVVLPDLITLSEVSISNIFENEKLDQIGNISFIRNKKNLSLVTIFTNKSFLTCNKTIFCFHQAEKKKRKNQKDYHILQSQGFSFYNFDSNSFFKNLGFIFVNQLNHGFDLIEGKKSLQKIKMRVKVENQEKKSFEEGIFHFQEYLMHFLSKTDSNEMKNGILRDETDIFDEKAKNEFSSENYSPPMKQKINTINSNILRKGNLTNDYPNQSMDLSREIKSRYFPGTNLLEDSFSNPFKKNQICIELCNIQRCNSLSLKEKVKKCSQRKKFCQKMLQNENFIALMENIMKQKHEVELIHLISELRNHLSNQQLFCIFAHFSYIKKLDFSDLEIINLIQALFKLNLDTQLDNNMDQSSVVPPISRNKNNEHFSSSITSN